MSHFAVLSTLLLFVALASCGPTKPKPQLLGESLIVGGKDAQLGEFPHQVSLRRYPNFHFCGGSILNRNWVLTAAHCTISLAPSDVTIVVGSVKVFSGGISHACSKVVNHPEYDGSVITNDVAVLRTETPINIAGSTVRPIQLINRAIGKETLHVSGWGAINSQGHAPDHLQWLVTYSIPNKECGEIITVNPDTLCARVSEGYGICFGDSGGPLIVPGEGQVGVNSFVMGGCALGYPDGFADVYYHRSWITAQVAN